MRSTFKLALLFFCSSSWAQDNKYLPIGDGFEVVQHSHYTLGYSEEHEQAEWVAYELLPSEIYGSVNRTDDFREDPKVSTGSAALLDYRGSGYDRGLLAPAADFSKNGLAMSESFYLSNMSPQHPSFNRGQWAALEKQVRRWVVDKGSLYVVTGAVLNDPIGSNQVSVPSY